MIAVCIATYNQQSFIAQCIESVLSQLCDEPMRIYIGDDSSMDRTSAICQQYAIKDKRIAYFYRETNMGVVNNTIALYRQIMADECEYIAMLDGDDYWTDPHKLQLQIEFHIIAYVLRGDELLEQIIHRYHISAMQLNSIIVKILRATQTVYTTH